jgi:translation elongation factor P/translation initiation factor 5A
MKKIAHFLVLSFLFFACQSEKKISEQQTEAIAESDTVEKITSVAPILNTLSADEQSQGYQLLFDGKTLNGFHSYLKDSVSGWKVEDGAIVCPGKTGSDLVTNEEFENFELTFEWKITPEGNSGVMYKVLEDKKYKNTYETGAEYQLIDDEGYPPYNDNGKMVKINEKQKSGANYDMQAPVKLTAKKPGEWNTAKILVNQNHIEHWLNGEKVVEYEYASDTWKKQLATSKFKTWGYATPHAKGKMAFQDHDHRVEYRNLKIKTL